MNIKIDITNNNLKAVMQSVKTLADKYMVTVIDDVVWIKNPHTLEMEGYLLNDNIDIPDMVENANSPNYTIIVKNVMENCELIYNTMGEFINNLPDVRWKKLANKIKKSGLSTEGGNVRPKYSDGVEAHTKFITNVVLEYNVAAGEFPVISLKPIPWKSAIKEVLWIYQDESNDLDLLRDKYGITWWDEWDIGDRTIGQRYGATVRKHNLIGNLINEIKTNPNSRRLIMDMWQEDDFKSPGLNPCCYSTTWNVRGQYLDVLINQRSQDFAVISGINTLQYIALQMMVAKACGLKPGKCTHVIANVHIYDRHWEQVEEMLSRPTRFLQPTLELDTDKTDFREFTIDDFNMVGLVSHGKLKAGKMDLGI